VSSAKISWDGGDVAPVPRAPRIPGRPKENSKYCKCAHKICLSVGVHLMGLCPVLCPIVANSCLFQGVDSQPLRALSNVPITPVDMRKVVEGFHPIIVARRKMAHLPQA
jgi:hypothetical protein